MDGPYNIKHKNYIMKKTFIVWLLLFSLSACGTSPEARLSKLSEEVNNQCPMVIDYNTMCDSSSYTPSSNTFTYYFSLVNYSETLTSINALKMRMEQLIPQAVRNNPELNHFRSSNVTLDYRYYSGEDGHFLFEISVAP